MEVSRYPPVAGSSGTFSLGKYPSSRRARAERAFSVRHRKRLSGVCATTSWCISEPSICCEPTGSTPFLRLKSRSASRPRRFSMRGNRRRWTSGSRRSAANVEPNHATHRLLRAAESSESTIGRSEARLEKKMMPRPSCAHL